MEIEERETGNVVVLDFKGEINMNNSRELRDLFTRLIEEKKFEVVANLSEVPFIDSAGIGFFIAGHSRLKNFSGSLKLLKASDFITNVLKVTNVMAFFEIFDDEAEAIKSFEE